MRFLLNIVAVLLGLGPTVAIAHPKGPAEVLEHHMAALKKNDIAMIMMDYADDAVVVQPIGVFVGKKKIREMFELFADKKYERFTTEMTAKTIRDDVIVERWLLDRDRTTELKGEDLFVIREGKIIFQAARWPISDTGVAGYPLIN